MPSWCTTRITKPLGLAHTALDTPGLIAGPRLLRSACARVGPRLARRGRRPALDRSRPARLPRHPHRGRPARAGRARHPRQARALDKLGVGLGWMIAPAFPVIHRRGSSTTADARRRHRRLSHLRRGRSGDRLGGRRAGQPGALGDAHRHGASCERCEPVGQHALQRGDLQRRREQVALAGVAAQLAQVGELAPPPRSPRPPCAGRGCGRAGRASGSARPSPAAETNVRSILSESTGSCCR